MCMCVSENPEIFVHKYVGLHTNLYVPFFIHAYASKNYSSVATFWADLAHTIQN